MATFSAAAALACPDVSRLTKEKRTTVGERHVFKGDKLTTTYSGWASGAHYSLMLTVVVVVASFVVVFVWWK